MWCQLQADACQASGIPVELCLTSNVKTESVEAYNSHHFGDLWEKKHPIVLCTDDSGVFCTSLTQEFSVAAATFNLSGVPFLRQRVVRA
jgi:adenosine deaminase